MIAAEVSQGEAAVGTGTKNMTDGQNDIELINLAAERFAVPTEVLSALLALEDSFQNFSVFGVKAEFSRQVTAILDDGSNKATK